MCGRARLSNDYSEIKIRLRFDAAAPAPNFAPSWNIPPTGKMLVATYTHDGRRVCETMRWGIIPRWAKDEKVGYSTFNARADSVATKPAFRDAWKRGQRCLVVTNGFCEWRKSDKQPFAVGMAGDDLMVMARLYASGARPATGGSGAAPSSRRTPTTRRARCTIACRSSWPGRTGRRRLGEQAATEDEELRALLAPCSNQRIKIWPVSRRVGNVRNDTPDLADLVA
jgi:putative SOS response-associated peptidase YedK